MAGRTFQMTLTYADAFFIYLLLWLLLLAYLARREYVRRKEHRWQSMDNNLFHCDKCHLSFVPRERINLCRCPRCNAVCIKRRRRD